MPEDHLGLERDENAAGTLTWDIRASCSAERDKARHLDIALQQPRAGTLPQVDQVDAGRPTAARGRREGREDVDNEDAGLVDRRRAR